MGLTEKRLKIAALFLILGLATAGLGANDLSGRRVILIVTEHRDDEQAAFVEETMADLRGRLGLSKAQLPLVFMGFRDPDTPAQFFQRLGLDVSQAPVAAVVEWGTPASAGPRTLLKDTVASNIDPEEAAAVAIRTVATWLTLEGLGDRMDRLPAFRSGRLVADEIHFSGGELSLLLRNPDPTPARYVRVALEGPSGTVVEDEVRKVQPRAAVRRTYQVQGDSLRLLLAGELAAQFDRSNVTLFPPDGSRLVLVRGGTFEMGSSQLGPEEAPPHQVTVEPFYLGVTEVTNAQYRRFLEATGHPADEGWQEAARKGGDEAPVVNVTRADAEAYCAWAGLRLPTEKEWEFAAAGSENRVYPWGSTWDLARVVGDVWQPAPVGSKPSGATPSGVLDLAGNVWEWTAGELMRYPGSGDGRDLYDKGLGVVRGGGWSSSTEENFRSAQRMPREPFLRSDSVGFRVARSATASQP